ncbi:adenylate/guanylate cyclase domain-containing protein [Mesorhizobium caraganae]|uniref:adenylate/guanylate cyclase domain-containing protein n=1 Tax=Mesorhizobium caraganae TaxID=483206 RepID=UPI001FECCCD1|nr:adenylate/guanylate cyclase domain-containing protein [Mesorhizobium caraganae]
MLALSGTGQDLHAVASLVTLILTATVWRSRQLVRRQVAAESERASLSRYFSPNIVRELSANASALDRPVVQEAAILFADMVGFTRLTERMEPEALIGFLREFHGRLARVAFSNGGTVDKYIGDAIMLHFGTPRPRDDDPVRALACAGAMIAEIERWNFERAAEGKGPIEIGIGLHYGEVVVGNIGHAQRLEFTVLGDAVNVASRLERLTRHTGSRLMISDDLVRAVQSPATSRPTLSKACGGTGLERYAEGSSRSRRGAWRRQLADLAWIHGPAVHLRGRSRIRLAEPYGTIREGSWISAHEKANEIKDFNTSSGPTIIVIYQ